MDENGVKGTHTRRNVRVLLYVLTHTLQDRERPKTRVVSRHSSSVSKISNKEEGIRENYPDIPSHIPIPSLPTQDGSWSD